MLRLLFVFVLSLGLSSQAVAAIKWNNPGSDDGSKNIPSCDDNTRRNYQTKEDIKGDGKWLDADTERALSKITLNGLEKKLNFNARNIDRQDVLSFTQKEGRDAAKFFIKYSHKGHKLDWERWGEPGFAQRYQILLKKKHDAKYGEEYWYSLSYFLEDRDFTPGYGHQLSLFDLKYRKNCAEVGVGVNMSLRNNRFDFDFVTEQPPVRVKGEDGVGYDTSRYILNVAEDTLNQPLSGRWVDIIMNIKWSDEDGHFRLWMDEELIINFDKGPVAVGVGEQFSFKFGPYRNHMPIGKTQKDFVVYYSNVGMTKSCKELEANCDKLLMKVKDEVFAKSINEALICNKNKCNNQAHLLVANNFSFRMKQREYAQKHENFNVSPQSPLNFPNEFVRRNVWENEVIEINRKESNLLGKIKAKTILNHGSPVDSIIYSYQIPSDVKSGKLAFIEAITNDGNMNTKGDEISYSVQEKTANLVEKQCEIKMLKHKGKFYPTFPIIDALKVSFERRGFNLDVLSDDAKCIINSLNTQYPEYWYELLHVTGKSIRGYSDNGNTGKNSAFVKAFGETQNTVKSNWRK